MAIVTLLEHLKSTKKKHTVIAGPTTLKGVTISFFEISPENLFIYTEEGHEILVDISSFKEIQFDAIVSRAQSSIEMFTCFTKLSDSEKYNAYLKDSKDNYIIEFYHIPANPV